MRPLLLALFLLPWLAAPVPAAADDPAQSGATQVGRVAAVEGKVEATLGSSARRVERGEGVYLGDWIETQKSARAKILLNDATELVVGPASRIHLDEFVYDPGQKGGKLLVEVGVGIMRFTSGVLEPKSYEVKTPVASIGVRGTIFDLIVSSTTAILREGIIAITTFGGTRVIDKKDHASTVETSTDEPEPQREVTDEEEKITEPLRRPFKDELPRGQGRPNIPTAVQKPNVTPHQNQPMPSGPPKMPSHRY